MLLITIEHVILALIANLWLVVYLVWSWRVLRKIAIDHARKSDKWLRLTLWAIIAGIVGQISAVALTPFFVLAGYNLQGKEREVAEFFTALAFWPYTASQWIAQILSVANHLLWVTTAIAIASLLLCIGVFQWFLARARLR